MEFPVLQRMRALVWLLLSLVAGCVNDPLATTSAPEDRVHSIYVVRHGWHTGVAVRAAEVPFEAWPFLKDFPGASYLELGWGDRDFYPAKDAGPLLALKAIFWPKPGVMHVVGFEDTPERYFRSQQVVQLALSERGFAGLVRHIRQNLELDAHGDPIALGPGLYGRSVFYASRERFHLFSTCNVWTARALRATGLPIAPAGSLTSEGLFAQIRALGRNSVTESSGPNNAFEAHD
jgi:uncharacterized protein (TIGR02117 family)